MFETKDNALEIFLLISRNWPKEQREKYLIELEKQLNVK